LDGRLYQSVRIVPLNTSISSIGSIDAISREALHNKAFTGIPPKSLFDVLDKSLNEIPDSLFPVKKEPGSSLFLTEELVVESVEEQAVKVANSIRKRFLNMNKHLLYENTMQQKKGPDNWPLIISYFNIN